MSVEPPNGPEASAPIHRIAVERLDGSRVELADYAGAVCLIVNVASRCGLANRNYAALEPLQRRYRAAGLRILAFPSNDFLHQEPGGPEEIRAFCARYEVSFDLFAKVHVRGPEICPLYRYLTTHPDRAIAGPVRWNFQKYLVGRDGVVRHKFGPLSKPLARKVVAALEDALAAPPAASTGPALEKP